jgi:hypothetical protein
MPLFDYPAVQLVRIHGPLGYNDYSSYRAWLRDEFAFRCVYCFSREQWGRVTPIDLPNLARLRPPVGIRARLGWMPATLRDGPAVSCRPSVSQSSCLPTHAAKSRLPDTHLPIDPGALIVRRHPMRAGDGNRDGDSFDGYPSFWYQTVLCQEQRE